MFLLNYVRNNVQANIMIKILNDAIYYIIFSKKNYMAANINNLSSSQKTIIMKELKPPHNESLD